MNSETVGAQAIGAVRCAAINDCADDIARYSQEEYEKRWRLSEITTSYDEGFIDALDLAEQRIRALAPSERGAE